MDNTAKKLKKGEVLFKEGDAPQIVYLIQSGKVGLMVERGTNRVEVTSVGASQVLGEYGLFSNGRHPFTAEALQETKYLEVPIDMMKQQFEKSPPGIKLMIKSQVEEMRQVRQQMKMAKLEAEKTPCPTGVIHRIFTELHLIARHIGKKDEATGTILLSWSAFKLYAQRFFGESPQRLRHLMDLLAKLKLAELTIAKNDEGEEELKDIKLSHIQLYEDLAEFYQYHLFKGGRSEAIYVDPLALKVAKALFELSATAEVDHRGASKLDYGVVMSECKSKYKFDLKNTHLDALEKKGLFVKRQSIENGPVLISFDRPEFGRMAQFWAILLEIDKWNEKGFVDLNEKEEVEQATNACPQCQAPHDDKSKFCSNCGCKLAAAA